MERLELFVELTEFVLRFDRFLKQKFVDIHLEFGNQDTADVWFH